MTPSRMKPQDFMLASTPTDRKEGNLGQEPRLEGKWGKLGSKHSLKWPELHQAREEMSQTQYTKPVRKINYT